MEDEFKVAKEEDELVEEDEEEDDNKMLLLVISIMGPALDGDSGVTFDSCVCCGTILINKMC